MNYALNKPDTGAAKKSSPLAALKKLAPLLGGEQKKIAIAIIALLINAGVNLTGPLLVGYAIDTYVLQGNYPGVFLFASIILCLYIFGLFASYIQTTTMGGVAQRMLFTVRNRIFQKLQELPVAFFNQNKAGDLISRINNDTDKLNQFFSQSLMQFIGSMFMIMGAGIFLLTINVRLGVATLLPAVILLFFTQGVSPWVRKKNAQNLQATGGMSAEIQESLDNFKVIVAFNRRDYFRAKFTEANELNFRTSVSAGIASNIFIPIYGLCSNIGQMIVLAYGIYLISTGHLTVGIFISYFTYATRFYDPLRQIAALWSSFQLAMAGWDRIAAILEMESNMKVIPMAKPEASKAILEFKKVHFRYPDGKEVLHETNFSLEKGKTYALVGPTGGGKTTTASLMARLYDPTEGSILLHGRDIRSFTPEERTKRIGFILQEPFLFTGNVRENILYGNEELKHHTNEQLIEDIQKSNLRALLTRFDKGLDTPVTGSDAISLGQRQLIAFMRAVLRNPDLLILDEATANIDTVTEQLLEDILKKLPKETTKVIIAHRLNTIENADEIFFVNAGEIIRAGSLDHAVEMLLHGKRES
jgi:ATP-binding cassette subfamily B protein